MNTVQSIIVSRVFECACIWFQSFLPLCAIVFFLFLYKRTSSTPSSSPSSSLSRRCRRPMMMNLLSCAMAGELQRQLGSNASVALFTQRLAESERNQREAHASAAGGGGDLIPRLRLVELSISSSSSTASSSSSSAYQTVAMQVAHGGSAAPYGMEGECSCCSE